MKVRIKTNPTDGVCLSRGTRVYLEDGTEVKDLYSISVEYPLDGVVTATLGIHVNPGTIEAHPMLSLETVKRAAAAYGCYLVSRAKEGKV